MKKLFAYLTIALVALGFSSCTSGDEPDYITEQSYSNYLAQVTVSGTGEKSLLTNVGYQVRLNYTQATAEIVIDQLNLGGEIYPSLTIQNVPFTMDSNTGWIVVSGENIISQALLPAPPVFNDFTLRLSQRVIGDTYKPCVYMEYTVNAKYSVKSFAPEQILFGETTVNDTKGVAFATDQTQYLLQFNGDLKTVNLYLYKAKFVAAMPRTVDMVLEKIPYTMSGTKVSFAIDNVIAKTVPDLTPIPSEPISKLAGVYDFTSGMTLDFTVDTKRAPNGPFAVKAVLDFTPRTVIE